MPRTIESQNLKSEDLNVSDRPLRAQSYRVPRLHVYGAMTGLTAGGSGSAQESSSGANKRP